MRAHDYTTPRTIQQAVSVLGADSRALAGGTDLLTLMKAHIAAPERLVNVKMLLPRGIEARPEGLEIGALTTLAEIEQHPVIAAGYSALAQAAALAASPQIRNLATIGGNLLQRPRCWYYRNARIDCWLKGGADCPAREGENRNHAILGGGPCYAVHPSGRKIAHARSVLSGVAPIPWRARAAERELQGAMASPDRFAAAAAAAVQEAVPLRHNGYKLPLTKALVRQALTALTDPACK